MRKLDHQRLAKVISEFVESCGFSGPIYLLAIGSNGSVAVSRHTGSDYEQVCAFTRGPGITAPIVLTVVAADGSGSRSAKIEIVEARRATVQ